MFVLFLNHFAIFFCSYFLNMLLVMYHVNIDIDLIMVLLKLYNHMILFIFWLLFSDLTPECVFYLALVNMWAITHARLWARAHFNHNLITNYLPLSKPFGSVPMFEKNNRN